MLPLIYFISFLIARELKHCVRTERDGKENVEGAGIRKGKMTFEILHGLSIRFLYIRSLQTISSKSRNGEKRIQRK